MGVRREFSNNDWLPTSKQEMEDLGWDQADVIFVTGDAYVDHPAFGTAIMARLAQKAGMKVAIIPQPNWRDDLRDFKKLGKPRLFFGVSAGNMDSMVNHYTALKRKRSNDSYTPGGRAGYRPDYATVVYSNILKKIYPETPVVIGGIEASMRRLTHYDYWQDNVKPSILLDSKADILVYGMAEQPLLEIIRLMDRGVPVESLQNILQTAFISDNISSIKPLKNTKSISLPSYDKCLNNKRDFAEAFRITEEASNCLIQPRIIQDSGKYSVIINPPYPVAKEKFMDDIFNLPYNRLPHPRYNKKPPIPAFEMIKHSVTIHRGCFGGCSFCAISAHQGKFIANRSENSIISEIKKISEKDDFKGHITDLGAPTANMYKMKGFDENICQKCSRPSCIYPDTCKNLNFDHKPLIELYKKAMSLQKVNKITIGSGVRYDMLVNKSSAQNKKFSLNEYTQLLISKHVSGRLKVAPEHFSDKVLKIMRKPPFKYYLKFDEVFDEICRKNNLKQELMPYFITGHPGSDKHEMAELKKNVKPHKFDIKLVQVFTPTPMTLSTTIYYTGINPYNGEKINLPKSQNKTNRK